VARDAARDPVAEAASERVHPFEEPDDPKHVASMIGEFALMFASDYPHWDFDSPSRSLPQILAPALQEKILWDNAASFYRLPIPGAKRRAEPSTG
jgi:uncharacterized protein